MINTVVASIADRLAGPMMQGDRGDVAHSTIDHIEMELNRLRVFIQERAVGHSDTDVLSYPWQDILLFPGIAEQVGDAIRSAGRLQSQLQRLIHGVDGPGCRIIDLHT